jgi:hypothetical protein
VPPLTAFDSPLAVLIAAQWLRPDRRSTYASTLAGFIPGPGDGSVTPVSISSVELGVPEPATPIEVVSSLVSMLLAASTSRQHPRNDGGRPFVTVDGDPLPDWTDDQWTLLDQEQQRLEQWVDDMHAARQLAQQRLERLGRQMDAQATEQPPGWMSP